MVNVKGGAFKPPNLLGVFFRLKAHNLQMILKRGAKLNKQNVKPRQLYKCYQQDRHERLLGHARGVLLPECCRGRGFA